MTKEQSSRPRLGQILLDANLITGEQLAKALDHGRACGLRVGESLLDLGYIDSDNITWALGNQLNLSYVDVNSEMVDWEFLRDFPIARLSEISLLPLSRIDNEVTAVVSDPGNPRLNDVMTELFPFSRVVYNLSSDWQIQEILREAARQQAQDLQPITANPDGLLSQEGVRLPSSAELSFDYAQDNVRDLIDLIEEGEASRALLIGGAADVAPLAVIDGKVIEQLEFSEAEADKLSHRFNGEFSWECELPGGFLGVRAPRRSRNDPPIRALSISGASGWLIALEAISSGQETLHAGDPLLLGGENPAWVKSALLGDFARKEDGGIPPVSFEIRIDRFRSGVFQAELFDDERRCAAALALAAMNGAPFVLLEIDSEDQLARILDCHHHRLILLWRRWVSEPEEIGGLMLRWVDGRKALSEAVTPFLEGDEE